MKRGRNIACLKRNGHWFYFHSVDEKRKEILGHAYMLTVDPERVFDGVGLYPLRKEIKIRPEDVMRENFY